MQVGDLVRWTPYGLVATNTTTVGLVVRLYEHKLWNSAERGQKVDFSAVSPEPFALVLFGQNQRGLPQSALEVISAHGNHNLLLIGERK